MSLAMREPPRICFQNLELALSKSGKRAPRKLAPKQVIRVARVMLVRGWVTKMAERVVKAARS